MGSTRIGLAVVCCLFGFGVFANANQQTDDFRSDVDRVASRADSRDDNADSAVQQQVAASWHTNDLLEIQIEQDAAMQKRLMLVISAVGLGVVLAIGGVGISSSKRGKDEEVDAQAEPNPEVG